MIEIEIEGSDVDDQFDIVRSRGPNLMVNLTSSRFCVGPNCIVIDCFHVQITN